MKRHASRFATAAIAAIFVLGACGSGDDSADEGPPPTPAESSDEGLVAPRPIELSSGGSGQTVAAEAAPTADRSMDAMWVNRIVTFVAGDGLELPTNDVGYLFEAGATVTAEQVAELAAGLGVTGESVRTDDGYTVYWRVGPDDGTAPSVWVYEDAQLSWNYNAAYDTRTVSVGCAVAAEPAAAVADAAGSDPAGSDVAVTEVAPDASVVDQPIPVEPCETPEPPQGVPTADEAEARTRELMTAIGLDPAQFTFEPYADEWYASVSAVEQLDGAFSGRRLDAGFGAEGLLQYAGGQLAEPVRVGPYPLIDLDTAIARLNDTSGFYGGGMYGGAVAMDAAAAREAEIGVAVDAGVAVGAPAIETPVDVVESDPGSSGGDDGAPPPDTPTIDTVIDEMPADTVPAPEQVTVTLVDVEADVWWAWDVDGSVWLLPAYRFIGDDGGWYTVPAVTDDYLVQVPVETSPVPVPEPLPIDSVPVETKPGESDAPVETVPVPELFDASVLEGSVGKTLAEFTAEAEALGATVRVVEQDGVSLAVTADFSVSRVNVAVEGEADAATVVRIVDVG